VLAALTLLLSACGRNMFDQPRADPLQASEFFADGSASRPQIDGTVSRERGAIDADFFGGPNLISTRELPLELSLGLLQRGQERFNIYCTPCHNYNGDGEGVVVQRGFPQPTSFQEQRLLDAPVGYYVNAMTNGFGRMFSYASRIPPEDRWAIAAYIKALQLSQNAFLDDIPDEARQRFEGLEVNR
jgi:mono/diheme cytochrome c family protein